MTHLQTLDPPADDTCRKKTGGHRRLAIAHGVPSQHCLKIYDRIPNTI